MTALTAAVSKLTSLMVSIAIKRVLESREIISSRKNKETKNMKHKINNHQKGGHDGKRKTRSHR